MPGPELRTYLAQRLAAHPSISSFAALSRASGVSQRTLTNWFGGSYQPTADPIARVALALGLRPADLWAAWNGDVSPSDDAERRARGLLEEAYERGFRAGFQAGRDGLRG
jgi:lambda repressor-like predicted transcriptional regulator